MPSPSDDPMNEVLARARSGDPAALTVLFERFTPILLGIARRRTGNGYRGNHGADDLVQSTWLTFLGHVPVLQDGRATPMLLAFLSRTLNFHFLNSVSKEQRSRGTPPDSDSTTGAEALMDSATSVVSGLARSELVERIHEALTSLAAVDQEIMQLRGFDRLPVKDVATMLGMTPNNVAQRYRRALTRLRTLLPGTLFEDLHDEDVRSGDVET